MAKTPNSKRVLGRLPRLPDLRDHLFLAAPKRPPVGLRKKSWTTAEALDQGQTSECVAYSSVGYLLASPVRNTGVDPEWLYAEAKKVDEWPGEDYDGTSVRAAFSVLKREGYITAYNWAFDVNTIAKWILTTGPVVVGTIWPDAMFETDAKGYVSLGDGKGTSQHTAGHAYLLKGVNLDAKCPDGSVGAFRILNSWGKSWGQNGCASISFKDMSILLREGGEGCMAVEKLKQK